MSDATVGRFAGSPATTRSVPSTYVLITPARNEALFIERTIQSVIAQTVLPAKWLIVSDGSTDGTDEIINRYLADHAWIKYLRMPERAERHFAGKAHAFNTAYERIRELSFDVVGSLDGDVSFAEDYFEYLLEQFAANPRLGVGGTPFREGSRMYDYRFTSIEHVSGACQLFRRKCFESIGGYVPIVGGGVDLVAVTTARMKGWETRSFPGRTCEHHRKMGTGMHRGLMVPFKGGRSDYVLGGHPAWELFRSIYQMTKRPFFVGGCLRLAGYSLAMLSRAEKSVSPEFVAYRRKEQMQRLRAFIKRPFLSTRSNRKDRQDSGRTSDSDGRRE